MEIARQGDPPRRLEAVSTWQQRHNKLLDRVGTLDTQAVLFESLIDAIDTDTSSGRFFPASWAVWQNCNVTIECTRAGLEVARQLGPRGGAR